MAMSQGDRVSRCLAIALTPALALAFAGVVAAVPHHPVTVLADEAG